MRGLAHPAHWKGPMGDLFQRFGAVKASPMEMYRLLKEGESVLLFPGGAREVRCLPAGFCSRSPLPLSLSLEPL